MSDRDGDGAPDALDACIDVPGPVVAAPAENGCSTDSDRDGVYDTDDACPALPRLRNDDTKANGCPGDSDRDGISDELDACPKERGPASPEAKDNGCPRLVRVVRGEIMILQQVEFATNSDAILPISDELLEQVAGVLRDHGEITALEVQGHTDNRGSAVHNMSLSQRRAQSVLAWLTTRGGLATERFSARGYGQELPIADNASTEGRQTNRRVQFKIIQASATLDGPP